MTSPPATGLASPASLGRRLGACAVCFLYAGRSVRVRILLVGGSAVMVEVVRDAGDGMVEWRRHRCGAVDGAMVNGTNGR